MSVGRWPRFWIRAVAGVALATGCGPAAERGRTVPSAEGDDVVPVPEGQTGVFLPAEGACSAVPGQRSVATLELPGTALDVRVSGGVAFVAAGEAGLQIVDVSAPAEPRVVGVVATPGPARSVRLHGATAFVACGAAGLAVIDVSEPGTAEVAAIFEGAGAVPVLAVDGSGHVLLAGESGLTVVDAGEPSAPRVLGTLEIDGGVGAVAADGALGYAYGATDCGIRTIDLSDPATPRVVAERLVEPDVIGLDAGNGFLVCSAAVVGGGFDFEVLDVHDASKIDKAGGFDDQECDPCESPSPVRIRDGVALVAYRGFLVAADLSEPGRAPVLTRSRIGRPEGIDVQDGHVYLAKAGAGLEILAVGDFLSPAFVGGDRQIQPWALVAWDGFLYVAGRASDAESTDATEGLAVYSLQDPARPQRLGVAPTPGQSGTGGDIAVAGRHAFVAAGDRQALWVIDVGDPAAPEMIGELDLGEGANGILAMDGLVWVAVGDLPAGHFYTYREAGGDETASWEEDATAGALVAVDVSEPAQPRVAGRVNLRGRARAVAAGGEGIAYVGTDSLSGAPGALEVIDLGDPEEPVRVGHLDFGGAVQSLDADGEWAVVGLSGEPDGGDLWLVDVRDRTAPQAVRKIERWGHVTAIDVLGAHAFVSHFASGLSIVDLRDPLFAEEVGFVELIAWDDDDSSTDITDVAAFGHWVYAVSRNVRNLDAIRICR